MRSGLVVIALLLCECMSAQQMTRIYVAPAAKSGLAEARKDLQAQLRRVKSVKVVSSPAQADAILTTDGDIYVKAYYSLNPRSGSSASRSSRIYGGYLSVSVKGASGDVLWSYFADTSRSSDPAHDLSKKIVKHFAETFGKT